MWYQKGISPEIDSVDKLREYLEQKIKINKYKKVCFLGNSMGGYAAILFGTLLNIDTVYAFSPQTFIDNENRLLYKDSRWKRELDPLHVAPKHGRVSSAYYDLKKVVARNTSGKSLKTHITIYHGINVLDQVHAMHLRECPSIYLVEYPSIEHNIARHMRDTGELQRILLSALSLS